MSDPREHAGGLNRYVDELRTALRADGVHVTSVVPGQLAGVHADDVVVSPAGNLARRSIAVARAARAAIGPTTVLNTHFAPFQLPLTIDPTVRAPTLVTFHGPWASEAAVEQASSATVGAKRLVERIAYRRAHHLVTLSHAFADVLRHDYGVPDDRITVVRPGVDLRRFTPAATPPAGRPTIFCVRRLRRRMGLDELIALWPAVVAEVPDAHLVIAGDGPDAPRLRQRITERHLHDHVSLLGRVSDDELVDHYRTATASIVPSVALEGFGLITLESLACGTPCIVTDVGGLAEIPRSLDPRLVTPAGDADALAERVVAALSTPASLPARDRCRSFAEGFTWSATAEQYRHLVDRLLEPTR